MPRKNYYKQHKFNDGYSENKSLNRYRYACKKVRAEDRAKRVRDARYWLGGPFSPSFLRGRNFVIRNPRLAPIIHNGKKLK